MPSSSGAAPSTRLLTPKRAGDLLGGVKPKTLAKWRCNGGGPPFVRLGSRVFYDAADLEKYVAELPRHRSTSDTIGTSTVAR
jgi:hypothetical protein